ncbi:unnamed protein product [Darwinula stevensoni]|uniref:SH3 domain-containing protein n=1 Tax=Darwinula stevensoni TaxID=69355 RepID=A0A7R8XBF8_9CRUS|nr:unnamed protein product [Darwinula stevensoni]CAG0891501.1 unnamed protein product [Darwinula stevensoni]
MNSSQDFVRAVSDYITREPTLLSFRKGDVIRVVHKNTYLEKGWLHGVINGHSGIFPKEYVEPVSKAEAIRLSSMQSERVKRYQELNNGHG